MNENRTHLLRPCAATAFLNELSLNNSRARSSAANDEAAVDQLRLSDPARGRRRGNPAAHLQPESRRPSVDALRGVPEGHAVVEPGAAGQVDAGTAGAGGREAATGRADGQPGAARNGILSAARDRAQTATTKPDGRSRKWVNETESETAPYGIWRCRMRSGVTVRVQASGRQRFAWGPPVTAVGRGAPA